MFPLKKSIIDGNLVLQCLTLIPVEWLNESGGCKLTGRTTIAARFTEILCGVLRLRDLISTARLHPGSRPMIVEVSAVPPPKVDLPEGTIVDNASLLLHKDMLSAKELEVIYSMMSVDYLVSIDLTRTFEMMGMYKMEMSMRVLKWEMKKERKKKLHTVEFPIVKNQDRVLR